MPEATHCWSTHLGKRRAGTRDSVSLNVPPRWDTLANSDGWKRKKRCRLHSGTELTWSQLRPQQSEVSAHRAVHLRPLERRPARAPSQDAPPALGPASLQPGARSVWSRRSRSRSDTAAPSLACIHTGPSSAGRRRLNRSRRRPLRNPRVYTNPAAAGFRGIRENQPLEAVCKRRRVRERVLMLQKVLTCRIVRNLCG